MTPQRFFKLCSPDLPELTFLVFTFSLIFPLCVAVLRPYLRPQVATIFRSDATGEVCIRVSKGSLLVWRMCRLALKVAGKDS